MNIKKLIPPAIVLLLAAHLPLLALDNTHCGNNFAQGPAGSPDPGDPDGPGIPQDKPCPDTGTGEGANVFSAFTGNAYREVVDLELYSSLGDRKVTWSRASSTRLAAGTMATESFGNSANWRNSHQFVVRQQSDIGGQPRLRIMYPTGAEVDFVRDATDNTKWYPPANQGAIMTQDGWFYTIQYPNAERYQFENVTKNSAKPYSGTYLLRSVTDSRDYQTTLTYDGSNRLSRVYDPSGQYLQVNWTGKSMTDQQGYTFYNMGTTHTDDSVWHEVTVSSTANVRYIYFQPAHWSDEGFPRIAELEFYDKSNNLLSGTPYGALPAAPGTSVANAFDGNPATEYNYAYPRQGFIGLDLGSGTTAQVGKIRFRIASGGVDAVKNGRFIGTILKPATTTVVASVETSDGRSVSYDYDTLPDSTLGTSWVVMKEAEYAPTIKSSYSYEQTHSAARFVIQKANDPRIHGSKAGQIEYVFDPQDAVLGIVRSEKDGATGQTIASLFSTSSALQSEVTYPNGKSAYYKMATGNGLMFERTDSLGRTKAFSYQNNNTGFLLSATDPLNRTTSYTRNIRGQAMSVAAPDGGTTTIARTSDKGLVSSSTFSGTGLASARTTSYTRDTAGKVTRIDYPDSTFATFTHGGSMGQLSARQLKNGGTESFAYYAYNASNIGESGALQTKTDAEGNVTTYTYYPSGQVHTVTNARGYTTSYEYNYRGMGTKITYPDSTFVTMSYTFYGDLATYTNELGKTWTYTYDSLGRRLTSTDPLNRTTQWIYGNNSTPGSACNCNQTGSPSMVILPSGKSTVYKYDTEWRLIETTVGYGTADAATTLYEYDAADNVIMITDPRGKDLTFSYDAKDRVLTSSDPLSNTTNMTYDAAGNVLSVTRPDDGVTENVYDQMNRLVESTDPKFQVTQYGYDDEGNLTLLTNAKGQQYAFEYDLLDRTVKMYYPDASVGTPNSSDFEEWTYIDNADTITPMTVYRGRDGATMSCYYDVRGRDTYCNYSAANTPDVTKIYDDVGRLVSAGSSVSASAYSYDDANQLLNVDTDITGLGSTKSVSYTYDADGNRTSMTYPDSSVVEYDYTGRNQLKEISAGGPPPLATYGYDLAGNRIGKVLENGTAVSYTYDDASRLTQLRNYLVSDSSTIAQFDYALNTVGNRTQKAISGAIPNRTEDYDYDAVDQITNANYGARTENFDYDAVGNRNSVVDSVSGTTSYTANKLNQYTSVTGLAAIAHDTRGNMVTNGTWTYTYDSHNRFLSATDGTTTATIVYDWQNRQSSRTINGTTTHFIYDGWTMIAEYDGTSALTTKYIHGAATDEMLAKIDSAGTVYYHQDGLGSMIGLTDGAGALLESYAYDIFGVPSFYNSVGSLIGASSFENRFLFTGREFLPQVSLYDYRNRMYTASLGRFLQVDPIEFIAGDANLYRQSWNSPVSYRDPFGLESQRQLFCSPTEAAHSAGRSAIESEHDRVRGSGAPRADGKGYDQNKQPNEFAGKICKDVDVDDDSCEKYYTTSEGFEHGRSDMTKLTGCDPGDEAVGFWHSHPGYHRWDTGRDPMGNGTGGDIYVPGNEFSTADKYFTTSRGANPERLPLAYTRRLSDGKYETRFMDHKGKFSDKYIR